MISWNTFFKKVLRALKVSESSLLTRDLKFSDIVERVEVLKKFLKYEATSWKDHEKNGDISANNSRWANFSPKLKQTNWNSSGGVIGSESQTLDSFLQLMMNLV